MNGIYLGHGGDHTAAAECRRSVMPTAARRCVLVAASLLLALAVGAGSQAAAQSASGPTLDGQPPSGTVALHEIQVAYIGNLGGGSGELTFEGNTYSFDVAGLGVGGIGISSVDAEGEVYKLTDLADFSGDYVSGQYG